MSPEFVEAPEGFVVSEDGRRRIGFALAAALRGDGLANAPQLSAFLAYVVDAALAGQAHRLSAYAVATEALGRGEDFNPQFDPLVRVTARRLRQALEQHNRSLTASVGDEPQILIELPLGGYAPRFLIRREAPAPGPQEPSPAIEERPAPRVAAPAEPPLRRLGPLAAPALTLLAVALLAGPLYLWGGPRSATISIETGTTAASRVSERIFPHLALSVGGDALIGRRFGDVEVVARAVAGRFDEAALLSEDSPTRPDYRLRLDVVEAEGGARLFARLERMSEGVVVWSQDFGRAANRLELNERVGHALGVALSPYGVLYADVADRAGDELGFECVAKAYRFFHAENAVRRTGAQDCINALIARGAEHPTLYALKAYLHLEGHRSSRFTVFDGDEPLRRAQDAAEDALRVGPGSARALQAVFDVMKVTGRHEAAARYAEAARRANPYDLDILTDVAAYYVSRGRLEAAAPLIASAETSLLNPPAWFRGYLVLYAIVQDDYAKAEQAAAGLEPGQAAIGSAALALLAHRRGDAPALREAVSALLAKEPAYAAAAQSRLIRRGFSIRMAARIGRPLHAAIVASGVARERPD